MDAQDLLEEVDEEMPLELMEHVRAAKMETLPAKSKDKYNRAYEKFKAWQTGYGMEKVSSDLILGYFSMLDGEKYKPNSFWAFYSMLKSTLKAYENIDIGQFVQVTSYLSTKSIGYKPVKAKVFTEEQIRKFIDEADNKDWLDVKVVCIFGICGALRSDEMTRITMNDVEKHGDLFWVKIGDSKTHVSGSFTIHGGFASIVQQYIDLRPRRLQPNERFFVNYQRQKCTMQFVGKNKFASMPRKIAQYLELPEIDRYTGHAFRRTSATFLANSGADLETIMRHGRWRTGSCAKGYIEDSLEYKKKTARMIQSSICGRDHASSAQGIQSANSMTHASSHASIQSSICGKDHVSYAQVIQSAHSTTHASSHASTSTVRTDNVDSLFDSSIDDVDLVDIVERASQSIVLANDSTGSGNDISDFAGSSLSNDVVGDANDRESEINNIKRRRLDIENVEDSNALSQSTSTNSTLNATVARSFKGIHFGRMDNCSFNFYLTK